MNWSYKGRKSLKQLIFDKFTKKIDEIKDKTRHNHYLNQDTKVIRWKKPHPYDYNELWIEGIKEEHHKDNWY